MRIRDSPTELALALASVHALLERLLDGGAISDQELERALESLQDVGDAIWWFDR